MEDTKESKVDSNEKNHPLSRESWIMLLSGEINKEEMKLTSYEYIGLAIRIAFFGAAVAVLVAAFRNDDILLYILCLAMIILMGLPQLIYKKYYLYPHQKRVKPLINTREAIISGKMTDLSERNRIWKDYIKKEYGKLLENNFKQKEVLHAQQMDVNNLDQKITRIEQKMERASFSDYWYAVGSFTAAAGVALLVTWVGGIGIYLSRSSTILFISGVVLLMIGVLMIKGADHAGTDLKKYPLGLSRQKLFSENKYLCCAVWLYMIFIVFAVMYFLFFHP